ncbi:AarF/ABC1/UbiB kinase family protein [uncultured Litoreibacter sp.]|uniref:ABC1 kinase family protein n=1 Tax=uncultured Litoreibacter sp. TaxID=1392394 RepID=UPI00262F924F|nr:AarF/ABC1/UbiB kinase family protein [uncultured Litoreibacter sp.]
MSPKPDTRRGLAVPSGRISRLARMGGLAASVAGNVALAGGRELVSGRRPELRDLVMTPSNAARLTKQLSQMRGAAMKMGQMLSMEAADLMPREFADILSALRSDAHFMPPKQLKQVLTANLGAGFMKRFKRFDVHPIAAASIGQVHRATTTDGRDIALKVQYPGVRDSIDSDLRNVASLIAMSGMLPKGLDIAPMLEEARLQLHDEADYEREANFLLRYRNLMQGAEGFTLPSLQEDFVTPDILGMSFEKGVAIEELATADQATRDHVATELIKLVLRELFEFGVMQTDPNFANYRYNAETGNIVLLDFGATRIFAPEMGGQYKAVLHAGMAADSEALRAAFIDIGLYDDQIPEGIEAVLMRVFEMAMAPLRSGAVYDFGNTDLLGELREAGLDMADDRSYVPLPPVDTLFLQRKVGGIYLLATRLKARVDMGAVLAPYL